MNITDAGFPIGHIELAEDEVQLWRVDLEAIRRRESRWQELLSSDERSRAARFHFEADRQRFVASRAWLRGILAAFLVAEPSELNFSYSKYEKPFLGPPYAESGVTFNVSHSGGIALYAFARRRELGVDVEQIRRDFDAESIARRFFSVSEQERLAAFPESEKVDAFFRCWTRKEAYIKAIGDGLSLPLGQFDVSLEALETNALLATRPDSSEAKQWMIREVPGGAGYSAALCVRGRDWRLIHWR
ncbi:MAG TPA: 4'-phosphopantetheinyl transferase superfamily protein [Candidatus Deferrimicrobiaceae bacterium]|nr:4'-phosphopantetheinyl transferase superfamily protein [Candidatus Deferrimicrobiaceae bacterium]